MKTKFLHITILILLTAVKPLFSQTVVIPDDNFRNLLLEIYPFVMSPEQELIIANADTMTGELYCGDRSISDLEGIQYFRNISILKCFNNNLTNIPDLSGLSRLTVLSCFKNELTALPWIGKLTSLRELNLADNKFSIVPDLSKLNNLKILALYRNNLKEIPDMSGFTQLEEFYCFENQITKIGKLPASLKILQFGNNLMTEFPDISLAKGLTQIAGYSNNLRSVPDLSDHSSIISLNIGTNRITFLPASFSRMHSMEKLVFDNNLLTAIPDLSQLSNLDSVWMNNNYLTFEDFIPSKGNPNFNKWKTGPQGNIPVQTQFRGMENYSFTFSMEADAGVPGLTFSWYHNGKLKTTTHEPVLTISPLSPSDSGTYYYTVTSSEPSFSSIILKSDPFNFSVAPEFEKEKALSITPDGDGRNDEFYFEEKGLLRIFDSAGNLLDQRQAPCIWNGSTISGTALNTGVYIIQIDDNARYEITIIR
jgi:hypothetical protein